MEIEEVPTVVLRLTRKDAEHFSHGLSDILCWCRGFRAALGETNPNDPLGVEEVRELRIKLKRALEESK